MKPELIPNTMFQLGENPIWYSRWNEFLFTDILVGVIYACAPKTKKVRPVLETGLQTGAFLVTDEGELVVFSNRGVFLAKCEKMHFVLEQEPLWSPLKYADERFNDAIVDKKGRMLAGTKRDCNTDGRLLVFESGKEPLCLLDGLSISNGMAFSEDGKTLYHTDSLPATIKAYDYDIETAALSNPRIVLDMGGSGCDPDGMTMDCEGFLWSVLWNGNRIVRFNVAGKIIEEHPMPYPQTSSLCFGGEDMKTLFITSASIGSNDASPPLGGPCFLMKTQKMGRADWEAHLDIL